MTDDFIPEKILLSVLSSIIFLLFIPVMALASQVEEGDHSNECVILLHGMARTKYSMRSLEAYLKKNGFNTVNGGYASTSKSVAEIAGDEVAEAVKICLEGKAEKIHFVTHSLGGIVVRQYLQTSSVPDGSRIVMLAPPNKGSELADEMKDLAPYRWLNGPAGQELGTDKKSTPNLLKPVEIEIGIIAGDSSLNPIYSSIIPGPDDGKVAVESTKLDEMKDFIQISSSHTFIMENAKVMRQTLHFLEKGKFDHAPFIKPFSSDGCSLFPDGTIIERNLWCDCCLNHDLAYWRGGTEEERKWADETLRACVLEKTGNRALSDLMYSGVRIGGASIFPTWYRWGYGWPYGRGNRPLTGKEEESARKKLEEYKRHGIPYNCTE